MTRARLPLAVVRRALATADRLARGSTLLARRITARLADWVARGRRHDLTGWRAALGPLLRLMLLAGLGWLAWRLLQARIWWLTWSLAALWAGAAWALTREAKEEAAEEEPVEGQQDVLEEGEPGPSRDDVVTLLRALAGDRPGVHLSTLLAHLQQHGQAGGWKVTDLRLRLEALHIPVAPKLKVDGVPKRGVSRAALDALPLLDGQEESPDASPAV
ncbi:MULTISPECIES: hypothetical protein [unclassified Streptomyces]|uniref:hypothetical protein n=1 Tax=unclassified Streptomyces TaxID=2593676 RepID=UPI00081D66BC|nr:hypothetical protein [Streptomyces sp. LcepLS]MYR28723.1 hypothetical protein [Streptomyces sp. SID4945]SCF40748.1 hypothetical protein GA0115257_115711 [Streptomyces sp. LcepLS]